MAGAERSREQISGPINAAVVAGRQLTVRGDWSGAVDKLTPNILETQGGLIDLLNVRGLAHRMNAVPGNYTEAEADFAQARLLAQQTGDLGGELTAVAGLIDLARTGEWATGDYPRGKDLPQAQALKGEAEDILSRMPEGWSNEKVSVYVHFGSLERELGNHEQAVVAYDQSAVGSRELLTQNPEDTIIRNSLARMLHLKGLSQLELGQYDEAIDAQIEARESYLQLNDLRGVVNTEVTLGRVYARTGNMAQSVQWYERAIGDTQRVGEDGEVVVLDSQMHKIATNELAALNPQ